MGHVTIGAPTIESRGGWTRWSAPSAGTEAFPESVWFEVPDEWSSMLTDRLDPALVALTVPAIRGRYDLVFEGAVSDELVFQHEELQALYAECGNGAPRQVSFASTVPAGLRGEAVAAGFSGGIDSWAMIAEYFSEGTPDELRLTHLLFNNVGSHAGGAEMLWRERYDRLVPITETLGLPFLPVNSNLADLPGAADYQMVNTGANAAVGHLLAGAVGTWIFASSVEHRRIGASPKVYNSAFVDVMALPLMSTAALQLRVSRSDWRRVDKARAVADLPLAWQSLNVCVEEDGRDGMAPNCSTCWKCRMTLAALDLHGAIDRFDSQFDLDRWRADRDDYLATARHTTKPALVAEMSELMEEVGYVVPVRRDLRGRASAARATFDRRQKHARWLARRVLPKI